MGLGRVFYQLFSKTDFLLHKLLLKSDLTFKILDFFFKSLIFECNHSKTVWDVFHDLKKRENSRGYLKPVTVFECEVKMHNLFPKIYLFVLQFPI
jgi:hypothetical protein